ncbi:hypothetical protein Tco_1105692 [Tanacetum coccineum]
MALAGSERDAKDALSKLLQLGTVEDYQREFEMLIKRVTIPESLLKSFYISGLKLDLQCLLLRSNPKTLDEAFSLARAAETRFANLDIWEFLRSNPSTLGEDFFKDRVTEACFEIIAKEDKEHIVEKKIDVILPLQGEFASPKAKGSLNADEYIGIEEVVAGGEALRIGEDDDLGDMATDGGDDAVESGKRVETIGGNAVTLCQILHTKDAKSVTLEGTKLLIREVTVGEAKASKWYILNLLVHEEIRCNAPGEWS